MAVLLPALVAAAVLLIARRTLAAFAGLGVALGYLVAHMLLLGSIELDPLAAVERMPWIVLAIGVLVTVGGERPGSLGEAALLVASVAGAWWITESARAHEFAGSAGGLLVGGLALAACAGSQFVRAISAAASRWAPPLLPAIAALLLAPALVMGRSAVLGQLSGAVAAACVAATMLCRREGWAQLGVLVAVAAVPVIPFLAACGTLYGYLDPWAAVFLGLAPLAAAVGLRREGDWSLAWGLGGLVLVSAVGLVLAYLGLPAPSPYEY
jgi:hypothetical protein